METIQKNIPIGIEDFKELIDGEYYYVDKTDLIQDSLKEKVVLYTRPRRFGKTLNMSMLYYFYSMQEAENRYLFDGLKISKSKEALKQQNQYPVIFLSLKDMDQKSFEKSVKTYSKCLQMLLRNYPDLLVSDRLDPELKEQLSDYKAGRADADSLQDSLLILSECLYRHYGQKAVILIDEYDVPLNGAWRDGYYDEMCQFTRSLLSKGLKSNPYLQKAILSGCLRISKESIFAGLNNMTVRSISDVGSAPYFGFTQQEINDLYSRYGFSDKLFMVKKWYDGYHFGKLEIYNPWSTLQYLNDLIRDPDAEPQAYWSNTSGNDIVLDYIENSGTQRRQEFEELIQGKSILKPILEELTYREMDDPDNIYSFLLLTGYLKSIEKKGRDINELMIPNLEVREIYEKQFRLYFQKLTGRIKRPLFEAMIKQSPEKVQEYLDMLLKRDASYYDSAESFYQGLMLGLLLDLGYDIKSNREAGSGRFDILLTPEKKSLPLMLLELKHADSEEELDKEAQNAVEQIIDRGYLKDPGFNIYKQKIAYGISFFKKDCRVVMMDPDLI